METTTRRIYQITDRDRKKILTPEQAAQMLGDVTDRREELGKKYAVAKRNAGLSAMRGCEEYFRGCGQGKLDRVCGLDYTTDRPNPAYNQGYYTGYNENPSGYLDAAQKSNPNFQFLNEEV